MLFFKTTVLTAATIFLAVCMNPVLDTVDSSEWINWLVRSFTFTKAESTLVMTGLVVSEASIAYKTWSNCRRHTDNGQQAAYYCAADVLSCGLRWGCELAAFDRITGWWKRSFDDDTPPPNTIIVIDNYEIGVKRGEITTIHFTYGDSVITHSSEIYGQVDKTEYSLGLVIASVNGASNIMVLESYGAGAVLTPMTSADNVQLDGSNSNLYVSGSGSLAFECPPGVGIRDLGLIGPYHYLLGLRTEELTYPQYSAFLGNVDSNSRLKCAAKFYDDAENFANYGDWNSE